MTLRPEIYDLYWRFAAARQQIYWRKRRGEPAPWTDDPILQTYKFCNAYRASDRVSQYLIRQVIYDGQPRSPQSTLFRIVLFKLFNLESTWQLLTAELGGPELESFDFAAASRVLTQAAARGRKLYNDAYIACATKAFGHDRKHDNHLALLQKMFVTDRLADQLLAAPDMATAFDLLVQYPLIGNFMAYQLATDLNYSPVVDWREDTFTIAGPGSRRGIRKVFADLGGASEADAIRYMYVHQDREFARLDLNFERIGDRPLQLIDCQNLFCELDKYLRVYRPELRSNRTKIKRKYTPAPAAPIEYFYPPKWSVVK